ncbi:MAG: 2-oxoacid:acceptor oxidoreductase family protein [Armatimonadota bacterium]|nr:2-oxoacid:acceptor oxidoreductase family protein [Armatimonadota bacterium]
MKDEAQEIKIAPKVTVRLSGTGGQGLLLAGRILAEAAAIHDGLNVVQSNSYGPEARGGASRSEVVISRGEVDDLRVRRFDVLVALSQKACDAYYGDLIENGMLIVDSTNVTVVPTSRAIEVPMTKMAVEECGERMVTNIIALGVLCGCSNVVTLDALKAALRTTLRSDLVAKNMKALELGYSAAAEAVRGISERKRLQFRNYGFVREDTTAPKSVKRNGHKKIAAVA